MPIGFQDLWVAGSRLLFKRDAVDSIDQPWVDLGTIETSTPNFAVTAIDLKDPESGVRALIDSRTIELIESYDIACRNFSPRNLAILLRGKKVETFSQTEQTNASKAVTHRVFAGQLGGIRDTDALTRLFALKNVHGVHTTSIGTATVTAINALGPSASTIVVSENLSGANPAVGSFVLLKPEGLASGTAQANAGTYEIISKVGSGPTTLTVREAIATTESGLTGVLIYKNAAGSAVNVFAGPKNLTPAWKVRSLADGLIYAVSGGGITGDGDLVIVYSTAEVTSGARLILPHTQTGEVRGRVLLFYSRGTFEEISVRDGRASITPVGATVAVTDYSTMNFTVKMLTDDTASDPEGQFLYFKGAVPVLT